MSNLPISINSQIYERLNDIAELKKLSAIARDRSLSAEEKARLAEIASNLTREQVKAALDDGDQLQEVLMLRVDPETHETLPTAADMIQKMQGRNTAQLAQKVNIQDKTITVNIPSDFATLQDALDRLSQWKPKKDVLFKLNIEKGHRPVTGISIINGDFGHFEITSTDKIVEVHEDFKGHFIYGQYASMPILSTLIDMRDKGEDGYRIEESCDGLVKQGCGVKNAGKCCLFVRASRLRAAYTDFSGGNDRTVWITRASTVSLPESNLSDCKGGTYAVYISRSSIADLSNSFINNSKATASALHVLRSRVSFMEGVIKNSSGNGIGATQSSVVSAKGVQIDSCKNHGIAISDASNADINGGTIKDCAGNGVQSTASVVNAPSVKVDNCNYGIVSTSSGSINARDAIVTNAKISNLAVVHGGTVIASGVKTEKGFISVADLNINTLNVLTNNGTVIVAEITDKVPAVTINTGVVSDFTTGSGTRNINHNLSTRPDAVTVCLYGHKPQNYIVQIVEFGSASIGLLFIDCVTGRPAANKEFTVYYKVEKINN